MSVNLNNSTDCCNTDCTNTTVNVPGPQGDAGANGTNGTNGVDGVNAYSTVKSAITVPAVGQTINLYVVDHAAFAVDQIVVISGVGHFRIGYKATDGSGSEYLGAVRLGYPDDTGSTGATIAVGTEVSPAGPQGPAGATGEASALLTSKGQLITRTNSDATSLSVAGNGTALFANSALNTGLEWKDINFTDVSGKINLGTQTDTSTKLPLDRLTGPSDVTGDLAYYNGTSWARLPKGSNGQILTVSGGVPTWAAASSSGLSAAVRVSLTYDSSSPLIITPDSGAVNVETVSISNSTGVSISPTITVNFSTLVDASLPIFIQDSTNFDGSSAAPFTWRITSRSGSQVVFTSTATGTSVDRLVSLVIFN